MGDIKKWFQPETTKKEVYEGIYPAVITAAKSFTKETEKDGKTVNREVIALTFKTLQPVPMPDKTNEKIVLEQNYYFDVKMHQNALNGLARAFGVPEFTSTNDFEGKTGIIGITNRYYENQDGVRCAVPQLGWGLFSYAPMNQNAKVEFIANEITNPTDELRKEWFNEHLKAYKPVV